MNLWFCLIQFFFCSTTFAFSVLNFSLGFSLFSLRSFLDACQSSTPFMEQPYYIRE